MHGAEDRKPTLVTAQAFPCKAHDQRSVCSFGLATPKASTTPQVYLGPNGTPWNGPQGKGRLEQGIGSLEGWDPQSHLEFCEGVLWLGLKGNHQETTISRVLDFDTIDLRILKAATFRSCVPSLIGKPDIHYTLRGPRN